GRATPVRGVGAGRALSPPLLEEQVRLRYNANGDSVVVHDRDRADSVLLDEADQVLEWRLGTRHVDAGCHHVGHGSMPRQSDHPGIRSATRVFTPQAFQSTRPSSRVEGPKSNGTGGVDSGPMREIRGR